MVPLSGIFDAVRGGGAEAPKMGVAGNFMSQCEKYLLRFEISDSRRGRHNDLQSGADVLTDERKVLLDALREELRQRDDLPIL
jgi:hypothetical protein